MGVARSKQQSPTDLTPNIINPSSNFVVITYWWGRGNKNKNMQFPCPEDIGGGAVTKEPITYDAMISRLEENCKAMGCNYMAVEYPDFARKGNYQNAINYKPSFILEALKVCQPRNVVYIDGDMLIREYPKIFDISGVDYMAQGWNIDGGRFRNKKISCMYPYVVEVSGGTMFFSQSQSSYKLLELWRDECAKPEMKGKAEDRVISAIINYEGLLTKINIIQLPKEYLWLSQIFDHDKIYREHRPIIEHPECLTGEERAATQGAAANREPEGYTENISDKILCDGRPPEIFYEYVFFPERELVNTFDPYLTHIGSSGKMLTIPYDRKYGQYNDNATAKIHDRCNECIGLETIIISHDDTNTPELIELFGNDVFIEIVDEGDALNAIYNHIVNGVNVIYIPSWRYIEYIKRIFSVYNKYSDIEFFARNTSQYVARYVNSYILELDVRTPMYFSSKSRILKHLLCMSDTFATMQEIFNSSFIFLSMIRCYFDSSDIGEVIQNNEVSWNKYTHERIRPHTEDVFYEEESPVMTKKRPHTEDVFDDDSPLIVRRRPHTEYIFDDTPIFVRKRPHTEEVFDE
jgi:hypothetical protein